MKVITTPTYEGIDRRNGNNVTWKWVSGAFLTLLLTGASGWMTTIHAQVEDLRMLQVSREGQLATLTSQMTEMTRRLGAIESKLDGLIDGRKRP